VPTPSLQYQNVEPGVIDSKVTREATASRVLLGERDGAPRTRGRRRVRPSRFPSGGKDEALVAVLKPRFVRQLPEFVSELRRSFLPQEIRDHLARIKRERRLGERTGAYCGARGPARRAAARHVVSLCPAPAMTRAVVSRLHRSNSGAVGITCCLGRTPVAMGSCIMVSLTIGRIERRSK
jgi:hypothetical protein